MEDLVGLRVRRNDGTQHGVLTWGRVLDAVDSGPLVTAYRASLSENSSAKVESIVVCDSLQELATCRYFFEGLFYFAMRPIPFGDGYEKWRAEKAAEYLAGCGDFFDVGDCAC